MRNLDFSSWQGLLSTIFGIALITLLGMAIRLVMMQTIQKRRERENRQINERLRTLIAAYKTLGGSFTGRLEVDPTHLRELRARLREGDADAETRAIAKSAGERNRRMRDAVEAALSDIILLGTEEQVRLAAAAARELAEGRPIHAAELVVSLRKFIRAALVLDPILYEVEIPPQGPARPAAGGGGGRGKGGGEAGAGRGGGGRGGMGGGAGLGMGLGAGVAAGSSAGEHGDLP